VKYGQWAESGVAPPSEPVQSRRFDAELSGLEPESSRSEVCALHTDSDALSSADAVRIPPEGHVEPLAKHFVSLKVYIQ
jgi:hypothetical protein